MTLPLPATGGCQCGNVTYQVTEQPIATFCCHCLDCQKLSTSSFSVSMVLRRSSFDLLTGDLTMWDRPAASGNITRCWFCPGCGNRIYHENPDVPDIVRLKPGTLDDTSVLEPIGHVWTCREQPWQENFHDLPRSDGQPDFAAVMKNLSEGKPPF